MQPTTFNEASETIARLSTDLQALESLVITDNLKHMTRSQREAHFKRLLDDVSALEDTIKAVIKDARAVRRARFRDDEQLSRMVVAMAACGISANTFASVELTVEEPPTDE